MEENKNNVEKLEKEENINLEQKIAEIEKEAKEANEKLRKEAEETNDRLKRIMAEFENYKKRNLKEKEQQYNSILGDVVSSLLPVIDNLEKAVIVETQDVNYKQGVELVLKQLLDMLEGYGVKKIEAVGKPFDPEIHDAISHVEDETLGEQIVKEEYRTGYRIGDKVIRHSMVIVAN